jgi:hypothetical protein
MQEEKILFEEKQFLGFNKFSIIRRMIICLFCFIAYYWSQNPKPVEVSGIQIGSYPIDTIPNSGELFFLLGIILLIVSALLVFVKHLHTTTTEKKIILVGLWTKRGVVHINFADIVSVKKIKYTNLSLKQPVFNLHSKGAIKFYTSGNEAIELIDKEGNTYRIGSQRANEFYEIVKNQLKT